MPILCEIITQERTVFEEPVDVVIAPSIQGEMAVLPRHAPVVAVLDFGLLKVRQGTSEKEFAIGGGILEVTEERVTVLADSADAADQIDVERAEEARRRAQKIMTEGPPADADAYEALQASIRRANLRLKVARRQSSNRGINIQTDRE